MSAVPISRINSGGISFGGVAKSVFFMILYVFYQYFILSVNTLDVGQEYKRYKNRSKTGVVKPKGIFYFCLLLTVFLSH